MGIADKHNSQVRISTPCAIRSFGGSGFVEFFGVPIATTPLAFTIMVQ
jgi:hypothetical protein